MRGDVLMATAVAIQSHLVGRVVILTGDISDAVTDALTGFDCTIVLKPFDLRELERIVFETMGGPSRETGEHDTSADGA